MQSPSETIPTTQWAVVQGPAGQSTLVDNVLLPVLHPGTVLIKSMAVSLNPSDNKMGAAFPSPGTIIGMDFAGQIVQTMSAEDEGGLMDLRVGDMVCGVVHGSNPGDPTTGSFAEYIRAPAGLLLRVPDGLSLDQAAALGTPLLTNCMALWSALAIATLPEGPAVKADPVLVYGGSTACGSMAIQLLKM